MASDGLTPENFINTVKDMSPRDRNKIRSERLIELILQFADMNENKADEFLQLVNRVSTLEQQYEYIKTESLSNAANIIHIRSQNVNNEQIDTNTEKIKAIELEISGMNKHLLGIEQYLRVNNIEIVGMPEPSVVNDELESHEEVLLKVLNSLKDLDYTLTKEDIDISHPIPTRRKDGKRVSVCKFISRKTRYDILEAKKLSKIFKFEGNDVFINEHLSPENRRLFALASTKRKLLNYKHLWTNNGITYMRKTDGAEILVIDSDESLNNLI